MNLSKKAAKSIATLVNRLQVSSYLAREAVSKGDKAGELLWTIAADEAMIRLADEFGIELPALDLSRTRLLRDKAEYAESRKKELSGIPA